MIYRILKKSPINYTIITPEGKLYREKIPPNLVCNMCEALNKNSFFRYIIKTGSQGNCTIARFGDTMCIIDIGISIAELSKHLDDELPIDIIFISHYHQDHYKESTLQFLIKKYPNVVLINPPSNYAWAGKKYIKGMFPNINLKVWNNDHYSFIDKELVNTGSKGIAIKFKGHIHGHLTDIGNTEKIPPIAFNSIDIEHNYDIATLFKNRCVGLLPKVVLDRTKKSHLSIEQAEHFINYVGIEEAFALHMSETNLDKNAKINFKEKYGKLL